MLGGVFVVDAAFRVRRGPELVGGIGTTLYWGLQGIAAVVAMVFLGLWLEASTLRLRTKCAVVSVHVVLMAVVWLYACLAYSLYVGQFF